MYFIGNDIPILPTKNYKPIFTDINFIALKRRNPYNARGSLFNPKQLRAMALPTSTTASTSLSIAYLEFRGLTIFEKASPTISQN
jgi:hypothetical protein